MGRIAAGAFPPGANSNVGNSDKVRPRFNEKYFYDLFGELA